MVTYPRLEIENEKLLLDPVNPRHDIFLLQEHALKVMLDQEGDKIGPLARHIAEHGLDPAETFMVIPAAEFPDSYYAVDGNRRLAAIKLLLDPDLPELGVRKGLRKQIMSAAKLLAKDQFAKIPCVVYPTRDEARPWIALRHNGAQGGVGQVTWDPAAKDRFRTKLGIVSPMRQVIEFVKKHGGLDADAQRKIEETAKVSHIERVLKSSHAKGALGIGLKEGKLVTSLPNVEAVKGLKKLVEDYSTGAGALEQINKKEDVVRYINSFPGESLPNLATAFGPARALADPEIIAGGASSDKGAAPVSAPSGAGTPASSSGTKRIEPSSIARETLIPKSFKISIKGPDVTRINDLYIELRKLDLKTYKECISIGFRVFIEFSVDDYIRRNGLTARPKAASTLAGRMIDVANHLKDQGVLKPDQVTAVRSDATSPTSIFSITTFNQYVHNQYMAPKPSELIISWNRLANFIEGMWR